MKEVAVGIIRRGPLVLICQRKASARYPLKWEFPGGKLEDGESVRDALKRELAEELGITVEVGPEFHRQEWTYPETSPTDPAAGAFRVFYHLIPAFSGTVNNRAFEQVRWVTPAEMLDFDILEGNRETVDLLVRYDQGRPEA